MEFRILGPLEAWDGGRAVTLGGPKPRALLAALLLHANEVVSADRLIDELWGRPDPDQCHGPRVRFRCPLPSVFLQRCRDSRGCARGSGNLSAGERGMQRRLPGERIGACWLVARGRGGHHSRILFRYRLTQLASAAPFQALMKSACPENWPPEASSASRRPETG